MELTQLFPAVPNSQVQMLPNQHPRRDSKQTPRIGPPWKAPAPPALRRLRVPAARSGVQPRLLQIDARRGRLRLPVLQGREGYPGPRVGIGWGIGWLAGHPGDRMGDRAHGEQNLLTRPKTQSGSFFRIPKYE